MVKPNKSFYPDEATHKRLIERYGDYGTRNLLEIINYGMDKLKEEEGDIRILQKEIDSVSDNLCQLYTKLSRCILEEESNKELKNKQKQIDSSEKYLRDVFKKLGELKNTQNKVDYLDIHIKTCPYPQLVRILTEIRGRFSSGKN